MKNVKIEQVNAALQAELNEVNDQYYGDLISYVRLKTMTRDSRQVEELLLEILQDIIEAQQKGVSAVDYFGKNPQQIADEILQNLSFNWWDTLKNTLTIMGYFILFAALPSLLLPTTEIDLGKFMLSALAGAVVIFVVMSVLGTTIYQTKQRSKLKKGLFFLVVGLGFSAVVAIFVFLKTPLVMRLSNTLGIALILVVLTALAILFAKQEEKQLWLMFIPLLLVSALGGILSRIEPFATFFRSERGTITLVVALLLAFVLQYVFAFVIARKNKQAS